MEILKENVNVFNENVTSNGGYLYTTKPPLSSTLANERITRALLALIDDTVQTLIDIGTGDGTYSNDIQKQKPDIKITGFDPAEEAIKNAKQNYPNISFFVGNILDIRTLPPPLTQINKNEKFDVGMIRGVLHHVSDPPLALCNAGYLSDRLIIMEPNGNNPILKLIEKVSPYHRKHEERSFSSRLLRQWCRNAGYEVEYLDFIGFVPFFFPAFLARTIYFFQPFLERIYLLKKYFGAQIIISCRKIK
jgi:hypothetical protein